MIAEDSVYRIGQISRTHGVRGEVNFNFTDDVFDRAEADYLILEIDGILTPFFLEEYRFRTDNAALVKFVGYDTAEAARELCGAVVFFPFALTPEDEADTPYEWLSLVGYRIEDSAVGSLGEVEHIDDSTANVLICTARHLIPAVPEFVTGVDRAKRIIHVSLPADILSLNE